MGNKDTKQMLPLYDLTKNAKYINRRGSITLLFGPMKSQKSTKLIAHGDRHIGPPLSQNVLYISPKGKGHIPHMASTRNGSVRPAIETDKLMDLNFEIIMKNDVFCIEEGQFVCFFYYQIRTKKKRLLKINR